jgi:hypothetical protein
MLMKEKPRRVLFRLRRLAIVAGAVALTAGTLTAVFGGPASAQSNSTQLYLANDNSLGTYAASGVKAGSLVQVKLQPWGNWAVEPQGYWSANGISGYGFYFAAITTSGTVSNLCLDDGYGVSTTNPALQTCGSDGTVWVAVSSGDGWLLYSRYMLDGDCGAACDGVLAVCHPVVDEVTELIRADEVGGDCYGRWLDSADLLY